MERLRQARAAAGYDTPSEAARAIRDLNVNTLISNENGNRAISRKAAEKYAKFFNVDAGWLLYGSELQEPTFTLEVPLLSMVSAGNLRSQPTVSEQDIIRRIKVGDLPKGDWTALQVEGDSMDRIAPDGAVLLVDKSDDRLIDGKYYIFVLDGGEATFKRYRRDPERLQPFSTNPDHMAISVDTDEVYIFGRVKRVINDL